MLASGAMWGRVGPATEERAWSYEGLLRGSSDEHHAVALSLLVGEARRRELQQAPAGAERAKVEAKWRAVKVKVDEARQCGADASRLRADLASKYPFMGMVTDRELLLCERDRLAVVQSKNVELLQSRSQSSASTHSLTSSADDGEECV